MYQYKSFVKDCLNLKDKVKSNIKCLEFNIARDLLEIASSTFTLEYIDNNIDIGDVFGLYDNSGSIIYIGVISNINKTNRVITCNSNISYFDMDFVYKPAEVGSVEEKMKKMIEDTFINSTDYLIRKKYGDIQVVLNTTNIDSPLPVPEEENEVRNFEDFIIDCYKYFNVICDLKLEFKESTPTLTIDSSAIDMNPIKVGNNTNVIQDFNVQTETFENNKLTVYNSEGTELRGVYYGTSDGITTDDEHPLRPKKVKNVIVFSDDEMDMIIKENLQEELYNHKITFNLLLNNSIYSFNEFKLGRPIEIWYNGIYFNSVLTGYQISKSEGEDAKVVKLICGKVRNSLTSKLLKYVG